jgi:hypothetical protein
LFHLIGIDLSHHGPRSLIGGQDDIQTISK